MGDIRKRTRYEQAQQTKQRLFDAAYSLLQEKDFKDITIQDIVKRSGVSTGTFYLYYSSKLDVYYQTYVLSDIYFAETVRSLVSSGDTYSRLMTYFDHYALYNASISGIKLATLLFNSQNRCFLRNSVPDGMLPVLHTITEYGLMAGDLDDTMTAEQIDSFLMDAVRGLVYNWCIREGSFDLREAMRTYVSRLYRSIKK